MVMALLAVPVLAGEEKDVDRELKKWQHIYSLDDRTLIVHLVSVEDLAVKSIELVGNDQTLALSQITGENKVELYILTRASIALHPEFREYFAKHHIRNSHSYQKEAIIHELTHLLWNYADEEFAVATLAHQLAKE